MFRLFQRRLLPHIIVCKRSKMKFSAAVDFFTCALFKKYWIYADTTHYLPDTNLWLHSTGFDSTLDVHSLPDINLWLHSTGFDSTLDYTPSQTLISGWTRLDSTLL